MMQRLPSPHTRGSLLTAYGFLLADYSFLFTVYDAP